MEKCFRRKLRKYINDNRNGTKLSFLGDVVFNLTTYSNTQSERLARDMLKVVEVITRGKTFEFLEDEENYNLYITCVNLAWFSGRLDWGTSIRGAWWATYDMPPIYTCELYCNGSQYTFKDVVVVAVDSGILAVMYKGIAQELGKDWRGLFEQANRRHVKSNWEDKLKAVFG